jgi:hypothetical protein
MPFSYYLLEKRVRKPPQLFSPSTPGPALKKPVTTKSPSAQPKASTKSKGALERSQHDISSEAFESALDFSASAERTGEKRSATMVADEDQSMNRGELKGGIYSLRI